MANRAFLDNILTTIQTATLSDTEFSKITLPDDEGLTVKTYAVLRDVLLSRENVSDLHESLRVYFLFNGVDVSNVPVAPIAASNILLGRAL